MGRNLNEVFKESQERARDSIDNLSYQRTDSLSDRFFYSVSGEQWNRDFKQGLDNKVTFQLNRTQNVVVRTMNDINKCEMQTSFVPKNQEIDQEIADLATNLYRADCNDSNMQAVNKVMHEEGVGGGFGAKVWEETEEDPESLDEFKKLRCRQIEDADLRVFFDPKSSSYDKSDARFAFIIDFCSENEWDERWPGKRPASFPLCPVIYYAIDPKNTTQSPFIVQSKESVAYATYYNVEYETKVVKRYLSITGEIKDIFEVDLKPEMEKDLADNGFSFEFEKRKKIKRIRKYYLSANEVLEDCGFIKGKYIPIVPFYHKRWRVYGVEQFQGVVRLLRDPAILENAIISSIGEISLSSPRSVPIFHPTQLSQAQVDQIANKDIWRLPFVFAKGQMLNGQEQPLTQPPLLNPPQVSPQIIDLFNITEMMFKDLTGNMDEGQKIRANVSAEAINLVQKEISTFSEMPLQNAKMSEKHSGMVWLSMAREVYLENERTLKTVSETGDIGFVKLGKLIQSEDGGIRELSLKNAPLETFVSINKSTVSKQQATFDALLQVMGATTGVDQETQSVLLQFALKNMPGEGLDKLRKWASNRLVKMGAVPPTPEQEREMQEEQAQAQQPSPLDQLTLTQSEKNVAQTKKTEIETILKQIEIEKTKAETAKIIKEIMQPKEVESSQEMGGDEQSLRKIVQY